MINQILLVIIYLCITISFYNYLTFGLHMFQLSSYHNPTLRLYEDTNKRNIDAPYKYFLFIPGFCALARAPWRTPLLVLGLLVALWFVWVSKPLPAKKPFVITARVKRLYFTATVLYFGLCAGAFFLLCAGFVPLLAMAPLLIFFVYPLLRLCNTINAPIEKAVGNYYINDAKKILQNSNLTVIGITGSFGKTSTKYFLNSILSAHFQALMTPASYNSTMGVVRTIREMLRPTHTHFIVEMGARHQGEIKEICDIVHPETGIITFIGEQHLETFGTIDTIIKTKMELADAVKGKGPIFVNLDSDTIAQHLPDQHYITYGMKRPSDYTAFDLSVNEYGVSFSVKTPDGTAQRFTTKLLGAHNVVNILGAIAMAHHLGMNLPQMVAPVAQLAAVPHRLELKPAGDSVIIDDAYNSNPTGAKAALDALNLCHGMKIIITPGMVELGDMEYELNYQFGKQIAEICDFACVVGKKDHIYKGLIDAGYPEEKILRTHDVKIAINHALGMENTVGGKKYILLENDLPDNY